MHRKLARTAVFGALLAGQVFAQSAPKVPVLSLQGPAYTDLPIWLRVGMPKELGDIHYPIALHPAATFCYEVELRRNGAPVARLPNAENQVTRASYFGGIGPCGFLGLPAERKHVGRLPLHLLYRLDQPGTHEVRVTRMDNIFAGKPRAISDWTTIEVLATPPGRRAEWIAEQAGPLADTVASLEDVLPGALGIPDAASLAFIEPYLYHSDSTVRRYAALGLSYWPEATQKAVALRLFHERGANDVTTGLLREHRDEVLEGVLLDLRSASPQTLTGALTIIRDLGFGPPNPVGPPLRTRLETALIEAADHFVTTADEQARAYYTSLLGQVRTKPSHDVLWRLVEAGIAAEQAAIAISWFENPADLPRLAPLLERPEERTFASIPYALRRSYGVEAIPYLVEALSKSPSVYVRKQSARELALANDPAGFAFIAAAIENNHSSKRELIQFVSDYFPEVKGADEATTLAFVKQRAAAALK